ncbi:hypothetical protein LOTGIDRAFT_154779 [Lottia gigantea]|uniref:Uncharacterized protein n=1 Tax=Lottia gigantea TaxID=225164 RepID=V3ZXD1_LOTGI|nr:hypothetical protein LOTGIDRAFT_154779 [Lottia gigantea]ESO87280.1 hypothetical protein LOTGIDRAFT_154779 [Lottia gigantea]
MACLWDQRHLMRLLVSTSEIISDVCDITKWRAIAKNSYVHTPTHYLHPSHAEYGYKRRELRSTVDWSAEEIQTMLFLQKGTTLGHLLRINIKIRSSIPTDRPFFYSAL